MAAPTLSRDGDVFVIDFGDDENITGDAWATSMHRLLDEVDAVDGQRALVTTGSAKHYSNGLDVGYMASVNGEEVGEYIGRVLTVVHRLIFSEAPTVAAVNGHAFGMGAFLILAHDHSVMRDARGFVCFPEIHLGMTFPEPLLDLARGALTPPTLRQALSTGHRYTAPEALAAQIVDETAPLDDLLSRATEHAAALAPTAGPTLARIKRQLLPAVAARAGAL